MKSEFMIAITQLAAEKNLPREVILEAMEAALVSAYKKDSDLQGNIVVRIDRETGEHRVFHEQTVVADVEDPKIEISHQEARKIKPDATIDDVISTEVHPSHAGRIAAQTAKQVVLQRLREAEREMVFEEFSNREGDIVSGLVQRIEPKHIVVDLGKTEAILPPPEQVRTEHYRPGQRMKFYLLEVHRSLKGPQLILSRTHKNLLRRLFELEVPEIHKGVVEIRSIAREAGYRSKVAVTARQEGVDPVGSCVGLRGIRIQNIVNELNGERIDVVQWDAEPTRFVANALSPAQVLSVQVSEDSNTASVAVPDRQLSLAIGREGQNARLAAKLTGWRIDIKPESAMQEMAAAGATAAQPAGTAPPKPVATPLEPAEPEREAQPWMEVIEGEAPAAEPVAEPATEAEEAPEAAAAKADEAAPGAIRFAEEVLASTGGEVSGSKKRKKTKKADRKAAAPEAKAKKTKRARHPVVEEEEFEEFDG
ncbi:MAG: transcription termination/antitermination protein NusA [Chloroflexi bacterium]|nr:transcription termination/antitermination protein NusA [Chloroflexota bacterium]